MRTALLAALLLASTLLATPADATGIYPCEEGGSTVVVGHTTVAECATPDDVFRIESCYGDGFRYYVLGHPSPCYR